MVHRPRRQRRDFLQRASVYLAPMKILLRHEKASWRRGLPLLLTCGAVIVYITFLIVETRLAGEPHLWRDLWKDARFASDPDDPAGILIPAAIFVITTLSLWHFLPQLNQNDPALWKCALLGLAVPVVALEAFFTLAAIFDFETDYTFSAGGRGILAFGVIYFSAFLLCWRALPLIPLLFAKSTEFFHRAAIGAVWLFILLSPLISMGGTDFSIEQYVGYKYHSG